MRSSGSNTSGFRCLYFNPLACAGIVGATEDSYPIWITSTWSSNILIQRLVFNLRIRQRSREILWYAYALVYSLLRKKNIYFHAPNTLRSRNHFFFAYANQYQNIVSTPLGLELSLDSESKDISSPYWDATIVGFWFAYALEYFLNLCVIGVR